MGDGHYSAEHSDRCFGHVCRASQFFFVFPALMRKFTTLLPLLMFKQVKTTTVSISEIRLYFILHSFAYQILAGFSVTLNTALSNMAVDTLEKWWCCVEQFPTLYYLSSLHHHSQSTYYFFRLFKKKKKKRRGCVGDG